MKFEDLNPAQLQQTYAELSAQYEQIKAEKLDLDLTRGKPGPDQLDLSNELDGILNGFYLLQDGTDVRNYGGIAGIPEARAFGAELLELDRSEVLVGGNSSLTLMYLYIDMMRSIWPSDTSIKFLCPVPGYDRHFTICEHFDIEMVTVPMLPTGPDMDLVEEMVGQDPSIRGMWCVPKYSNPTGQTYSDETVKRIAKLPEMAGEHFRIMWDNAYIVHHLNDAHDQLANIMQFCRQADTADSVIILASTSKITFAGAGIAFLAASTANLAAFEAFLSVAMIGFDKVNQLRHVRFLEDTRKLAEHMDRHKAILRPKFDLVESILSENLKGKAIAEWTTPNGGYFVSLDTLPGLASEIITMAGAAGVKLTPAGATFPYGQDPEDRNIRIAPTFPSISQLQRALEVLVVCIQLCSAAHLMQA